MNDVTPQLFSPEDQELFGLSFAALSSAAQMSEKPFPDFHFAGEFGVLHRQLSLSNFKFPQTSILEEMNLSSQQSTPFATEQFDAASMVFDSSSPIHDDYSSASSTASPTPFINSPTLSSTSTPEVLALRSHSVSPTPMSLAPSHISLDQSFSSNMFPSSIGAAAPQSLAASTAPIFSAPCDKKKSSSSKRLSSKTSKSPEAKTSVGPTTKRTKRRYANIQLDEEEEQDGSSSEDKLKSKKERNKVSASKYRKRRKLYLEQLETKASELEQKVHEQDEQLQALNTENKVLKEQVAFLQNLISNKMELSPASLAFSTNFSTTTPFLSNMVARNQTSRPSHGIFFVLFSVLLLFFAHWTSYSSSSEPSLSQIHVGRSLKSCDSESPLYAFPSVDFEFVMPSVGDLSQHVEVFIEGDLEEFNANNTTKASSIESILIEPQKL